MSYSRALLLLIAGLLTSTASIAAVDSDPKWRLFDPSGMEINPFASSSARALVFIFVSVDCPISNSYAPEYGRLAAEFGKNGIEFTLIYPIADQSASDVKKHLADFGLKIKALRDPRHDLVKMAKARVTPEAAVFVPGTGWIYRGRIDDRNVDFGKKRPAATQHDLREALQSIVDGKPITSKVTRAVGCYIPD